MTIDLNHLNSITNGDENFKKELIGIFLNQIPVFIHNMKDYLDNNKMEKLAREAHTAKSSALIFGMENTGKLLKEIQYWAENKMTMRHLFEDIHAEPLPEFHDPLLVAGGAKVAALAGEGQQVLVAAILAFDPGKAIAQVAAIQVLADHFPQIGTEESIGPLESLFVTLDEVVQVILNAAVIVRCLRIAGAGDLHLQLPSDRHVDHLAAQLASCARAGIVPRYDVPDARPLRL